MPFLGTETLDVQALTNAIAASGVLHTVTMGLFTNPLTPGRTTPLSAFTEPTYSNYARQAVVWGPVGRDDAGVISSTANLLSWQMANGNNPTTIYGYFLVATVSVSPNAPACLGCELFGSPVALNDALDVLNTVFEFIQTNDNQGEITLVA